MKIANNTIINRYKRLNEKTPQKSGTDTNVLKKRRNTSFKGIEGLFKTNPELVPQLEILPSVSDNYITRITKQISNFSREWLKKFKSEGYKIILTPKFTDAYKAERVFDPAVEYFERINPKGTLGVTYAQGKFGKNFFAFCDKPPFSDIYMPSIVNHELSHGIVNIKGIDKSQKTLELLKKDVDLLIKNNKLNKLSQNERDMLFQYFFKKNAYLPVDEIAADVCAWNRGGGIYGSGMVLNVNNHNLMTETFPNLSKYLKDIKP